MYGCQETDTCQLNDIPECNLLQFFCECKQDPHRSRSDKKPVPDKQAFIQVNKLAQNAGEACKKYGDMKLEKSFFH